MRNSFQRAWWQMVEDVFVGADETEDLKHRGSFAAAELCWANCTELGGEDASSSTVVSVL